jgi:DNA anti-recombination protein RmuC
VVLAATNTRVEREQGRWAAQFALLPQRAARVDETTMRRMRQELEAEMASRFQKERQATIDSVNQRLEESRRALVQDLSVALARQEETLRAGYQSDRQEMRRRDRTVEQLVGNEMSRTRQWLGQVLNASQKPVIEQ